VNDRRRDVKQAAANILRAAIAEHEKGFRPVILYPAGAKHPHKGTAEGKEPFGPKWGLKDTSPKSIAEDIGYFARRGEVPGVGLCLGPGRGPDGSWLGDLEGDGPGAEDSRLRLFGGQVIETRGWSSTRGNHGLFLLDGERLHPILARLKRFESKHKSQPGVYHFDALPGLELRVGGLKPDGAVKQLQSAIPPTPGTDGRPREWNGVEQIAAAPAAFYDMLEAIISQTEAPADPMPPLGSAQRGERSGRGRRTAGSNRVDAYLRQALTNSINRVKSATEGNRHNTYRNEAYELAGYLHYGLGFTEQELEQALTAARAQNVATGEHEFCETVRDSIRDGKSRPLKLPPELHEVAMSVRVGHGSRGTSRPNGHHASTNGYHSGGPEITDRPPQAPEAEPIHLTDLGNAMRLAAAYGANLRHCYTWGAWFEWDGARWKEDTTGRIYGAAKATVRGIMRDALEAEDDKERKELVRWALASEERKRIESMIALARFEKGIPVEPHALDVSPWLLNSQNGTVDLRSGELRAHSRDDLLTKLAPVDYHEKAACPRFLEFLSKIMDGNGALIGFIQRALGYALTADVSEHVLFFLYGTGRNGKSTLLDLVRMILGDYATSIDASVLTAKVHADHPTALTDLNGRRFVPTIEVDDGQRMAEALVKKLTGGDRIKARRMRQDFFEFDATHKIFLAANHQPAIRGTDEAIWSRILMIPFKVFIEPKDRTPNLSRKLFEEEGSGILKWMIQGCLEWQRGGLKPPEEVRQAVQEYRNEQDSIGVFLATQVEKARDDFRIKASTLHAAYCKWSGESTLSQKAFGQAMVERGYAATRSNGMWYTGLRFAKEPDDGGTS
jgi:P4 family phage/plasmid primase-like protien